MGDPLCRLADQSGYKHGVEVEFRFADEGVVGRDELTRELKIVRSLAKFGEKGRMRVVGVGPGGRESVVYSSGGVVHPSPIRTSSL